MSKMKELSQTLDELTACGNRLIDIAQDLRDLFSGTETTEESVTATEEATTEVAEITMEELRERLAKKAEEEDGRFKVQVKELVKKYADGGTLRAIPKDKYPAVIAELEVIA